MRHGLLAASYGFIAGAAATVVLWIMGRLTALVWSGSGADSHWYIFAVVMTGGVLIAILRHWHEGESLEEQVGAARAPDISRWRTALILALMAIVAIAFGGSVGPEAGILAVVTEMSAVISWLIARNHAEARMIGEIGAAGALGGFYGSPPGGAAMAEERSAAPRWQIYLAGVAGLFGFMLAANYLLEGGGLRIHLPPHNPARDGTDMLWAIIPSIGGAIFGLMFALVLPRLKLVLARLGGVTAQTLAGTALFAALAAAFPILRFSGHHEMEQMLHWAQSSGAGHLITLSALKVIALSLCLAAGWRGGSGFPLLFIGAATGAATVWFLPAMPITVALVAAMTATLTAGMGQPFVAMLIALFLIGPVALAPFSVGAMIGWGASKLVPKPELH